jgi:ATP-dependent Clp protease ATP-binding subunit ClpA
MFEHFTQPAREIVVYAQVEASLLGHGYVGTEHLLLGVLREGEGAGARALRGLGVDLDTTRADVADVIGRGPLDVAGKDAEALRSIGIDVDEVRRRIEEAFGPGALDRLPPDRWRWRRSRRCDPLPGHVPFTPKAKKVLQLSLREATALGHGSIGTEHILLGLAREREGIAAQLLQRRGAGDRDIRRLVEAEIERGRGMPGRSA